MAKKKIITVQMSRTVRSINQELLKWEKAEKKKAKRDKIEGESTMAWINGYVSGAQWVLSQILGY